MGASVSASVFGAKTWTTLHFLPLDVDVEWFALEMTQDHSVIFEIAPKYCISDSFVDHDGYSLLLSPVTSTTGYCFCFGSILSFFLELFLH